MFKNVLLTGGIVLFFLQQYLVAVPISMQFYIFLAGVFFLGVPHGALDLLVATKNASLNKKSFSKIKFFGVYVGRLLLFSIVLYFFPVAGNIIFIFFAAYHFGETDLHQFNTQTLLGKNFVLAYGLMILSMILLVHFDEVQPMYQFFESGRNNNAIINWISNNRFRIVSVVGIYFFVSTFIYFLRNSPSPDEGMGQFLIRLAILMSVLFSLPLLLGFSFYFIFWHSLLSLQNILGYLTRQYQFSRKLIIRQVLFYSLMAMGGIALFGSASYMFLDKNSIAGYIFLGLAVLTAPHMGVMYEMYLHIRQNKLLGGKPS